MTFGESVEEPAAVWRTDGPEDGRLVRLRRGGGLRRVLKLKTGYVLAGTDWKVRFLTQEEAFPQYEKLTELDEPVTPRYDRRERAGHLVPEAEDGPSCELFRIILEMFQPPGEGRRFLFGPDYREDSAFRTRPSLRPEGPWIFVGAPLVPAKHFARIIPAERASQLRAIAEVIRRAVDVDGALLEEFINVTAAAWLVSKTLPWLKVPAPWTEAVRDYERLDELESRRESLRKMLPEEVFHVKPLPLSFRDEVEKTAFLSGGRATLEDMSLLLDSPNAAPEFLRDAAFYYPTLESAIGNPNFPADALAEAATRGILAIWDHPGSGDTEREALLDALAKEDPLESWQRRFLLDCELKPEWTQRLAERGGGEVALALIERGDLLEVGYRILMARFAADDEVLAAIARDCRYIEVLEELALLDGTYACAAPALRLTENQRASARALEAVMARSQDTYFNERVRRNIASRHTPGGRFG